MTMSRSYRPVCWTEDTPRVDPLVLPQTDQFPAGEVHWRLNSMLREYQREGVIFMWDRLGSGGGGILCDDMGLGKTVQVISLLSALYNKCGDLRDRKLDRSEAVPTLIIW